jgi:adenylate kinase
MGPPGVGKGTQAARLQAEIGAPHISTGDLLRDAVKSGSALGRKARSFVESGDLVPDDLMGDLIAERLGKDDAQRGFILDGFPRTVEQVTILQKALDRLGVALTRAFLLTAHEEEIVRRLSGRRICPVDGALYHVDSRPPKSPGTCDRCGSALIQREDDTEEVIRKRLQVYARQTLPVADAYRAQGILVEVDGAGEPDAVFGRLREGLAA